jgi:hypothetical protein
VNARFEHTHVLHSVNYLLKYRLRWGEPDRITLLPSSLQIEEHHETSSSSKDVRQVTSNSDEFAAAAVVNPEEEQYFKADGPPNLISIIQNDWPYSGKLLLVYLH